LRFRGFARTAAYYLDSTKALDLLVQYGRAVEIHPAMEEEIRLNRQADYAGAVMRGQHMKLGFLQHSLMISRMHFMLEMSSRELDQKVQLAAWRRVPNCGGTKSACRKLDPVALRARTPTEYAFGLLFYLWELRQPL
jgi:hypothetical protein